MSLDISKLSSFSREAYHKIILLHPEWEKYAKIETRWKNLLSIEISSPVPEIFPIKIVSEDDEPEEITIWFGPAHRHLCWHTPRSRHSLDGQLLTLEEIVQKIFTEELIGIQKKPGFFSSQRDWLHRTNIKNYLIKESCAGLFHGKVHLIIPRTEHTLNGIRKKGFKTSKTQASK
jgi:hypothetical protein